MQKNLCLVSLLLTASLGLASAPARADQQVNTQITNQSAGAVGDSNLIYQQSDQLSIQQHKRMGRASSDGLQDNFQQVDQSAAAVGNRNYVEQRANQMNIQQRSQRHFHPNYSY